MSMREWNDTMYGIEFPCKRIDDGNKVLTFISNHKQEMIDRGLWDEDDLPTTAEEALVWADSYFDSTEAVQGEAALVADVAGEHIYATSDESCDHFVGIYAIECFPWDERPDKWLAMTPEKIEAAIRPLVEELYGECPIFREHTVWQCG